MLNTALEYATLGFKVFPAKEGLKTPATKNGFKDASSDPEQIKKWWTENHAYNVAVRTGKESGIFCLDIDCKGEKNGFLWLDSQGELPNTVVQNTPSGGKQFLFKLPDFTVTCSSDKIAPGVDIRGDGGYIMAPPSFLKQTPTYAYSGTYEWLSEQDPQSIEIANAPDWLLNTLIELIPQDSPSKSPEDCPPGINIPITEVISKYNISLSTVKNGVFAGSHPIHGSTNGENFRIDTNKNVWSCYRHTKSNGTPVGGGSLQLIAMMEGIIDCPECVPGALKGLNFKKLLTVLEEKFNYKPEGYHKPIESVLDDIITNEHFSIMGQYSGKIFIYSHRSGEFISLKSNEITKGELRRLAPITWWESFLPFEKMAKQNAVSDNSAELIVRGAEKKGIFDAKKIRGCGAWMDDGKAIFHLGTKILIGNEYVDVRYFPSEYVYPIKHDLCVNFESPLLKEESIKVFKLSQMLSWEDNKSAMLFAGWLFTAPLCGALHWRSHIYIIGGAGTGKSFVANTLMPKVLGDLPLKVQGSSTEAGIRQALDNDARPIIFDEAEGNDQVARARLQAIIQLARQASTPDGAPIVKGSASQNGANSYYVRSAFALSSIDLPIKEEADKQRFTILRLKPFETSNLDKFKEIVSYSSFLTPTYSAGLLARGLKMLPIIRENQRIFMEQGEIIFGKRRIADQMSMMLSGLYSLIYDTPISPEYALEWLSKHDWSEQKEIASSSHSIDLLNHILDYTKEYTLDNSTRISRTIRELLEIANTPSNNLDHGKISQKEALDILKRHGIRIMIIDSINMLVIANRSEFIKSVLKDTHWNYPCYEVLSRVPGASRMNDKSVRFDSYDSGGIKCVFIPLDGVFGNIETNRSFSTNGL